MHEHSDHRYMKHCVHGYPKNMDIQIERKESQFTHEHSDGTTEKGYSNTNPLGHYQFKSTKKTDTLNLIVQVTNQTYQIPTTNEQISFLVKVVLLNI